MCGITGFSLKKKNDQQFNILKLMNDKLLHRGPDGEGFYNDENISLAHKRLAIIDLNPRSDQPFSDKSLNYTIVFNGEIYNYLELKDKLIGEGFSFNTSSDTEVLLNAYICWGPKLLEKIKGMFSFAIYDKIKKIVFCSRDHFGQKPFYYYYKDGDFIFSSELTSLIAHPSINRSICIKSITNYLHYDSFIDNTTPIKNCFKLLPSQYLIFDISSRNLKKNEYWNIKIPSEKKFNNDYHEEFVSKLIKSTEMHLRSDVPIALYLSGGVDSTTLACISKKILNNQTINSFNLKFKNKTFNENILAENTANKLNLKLTTFNLEDSDFISVLEKNVNNLDEPLADLGYLAIGFIANFVSKEGYKVVISGDGGDEMLMGYEPFQKYWIYNLINNFSLINKSVKYITSIIPDSFEYMGLPHKMKIFAKALGFPKHQANSRWISSFLPNEIESIGNDSVKLSSRNLYDYINKVINSIDSNNKYDQLSIQYQKHFLTNLICSHTDKANMNYSIEARSPFLDPELFNFANQLPKKLKLKGNVSKIILRNFLKKTLNNETFKAPKKGFTVPMALWIKKDLKKIILDTLNENTIKKLGFIDYKYLNETVIRPHLENKSNNYKKIWNIFVLVNWLKINQLV